MSGKVAVVHNGIIENYQELKDDLQALGYVLLLKQILKLLHT